MRSRTQFARHPGDCRTFGRRVSSIGPFGVEFIPVAHSIPESHALAIHTAAGIVVHTGDWKIDPTPIIGPPTDERRFRELGDEGVLALIGDSTNAVREGARHLKPKSPKPSRNW